MRLHRALRSAPVVCAFALCLAAPALTGCSGDDDADSTVPSTTGASAPTSTAAPETTATPTTPSTTAAPVLAAFGTPSAAGTALFGAWTKSDRNGAGALNLAPPAELDKLFAAVPLPSVKNRGCDDGEFGSASCFFGNGQGGVNVTLAPAPGGWSISTIDPFG